MLNNFVNSIMFDKFKLSLEIHHSRDEYSLYINSRTIMKEKVEKQWVLENKHLFKSKYHIIIDNLKKNLKPVIEPKAVSINLDTNQVTCLNYIAEEITVKLSTVNAIKLNISNDLVTL